MLSSWKFTNFREVDETARKFLVEIHVLKIDYFEDVLWVEPWVASVPIANEFLSTVNKKNPEAPKAENNESQEQPKATEDDLTAKVKKTADVSANKKNPETPKAGNNETQEPKTTKKDDLSAKVKKIAEKAADISDEAIIRVMLTQGKSENQARCALDLLKRLEYNQAERFEMLSDPNCNVHLISIFGSLTPVFVLSLAVAVVIFAALYEVFFGIFWFDCWVCEVDMLSKLLMKTFAQILVRHLNRKIANLWIKRLKTNFGCRSITHCMGVISNRIYS